MPWNERDAASKTKMAKSPKRKRQWRDVANSVLERTGDEGRAVRSANAVVKKGVGKRKSMKRSKRDRKRPVKRYRK